LTFAIREFAARQEANVKSAPLVDITSESAA
jgi:hypothetical protein